MKKHFVAAILATLCFATICTSCGGGQDPNFSGISGNSSESLSENEEDIDFTVVNATKLAVSVKNVKISIRKSQGIYSGTLEFSYSNLGRKYVFSGARKSAYLLTITITEYYEDDRPNVNQVIQVSTKTLEIPFQKVEGVLTADFSALWISSAGYTNNY